jgi:hypothetical protein
MQCCSAACAAALFSRSARLLLAAACTQSQQTKNAHVFACYFPVPLQIHQGPALLSHVLLTTIGCHSSTAHRLSTSYALLYLAPYSGREVGRQQAAGSS